jgi:hypothetical protein
VTERELVLRRPAVWVVAAAVVIGTTLGAASEARAQGTAEKNPAADKNAPATAASPAPAAPAEAAPPAPAAGDATPAAPADSSAVVSSGGGLFESSQSASDTAPAEDSGGSGLPFDFNGYVRGDAFIGKMPDAQAAEMKAAYGELSLKIQTKKLKYGDAFAEARLRYGLQQGSRIQLVDLREAYVNLYTGPLDIRLGQQIIVWGRADAVNPTNNLTPSDLRVHSPNEDDRRVGNFAARAFLNFQPIRIEGAWVPLYLPSEIPLTLPDGAQLVAPNYPNFNVKNSTVAGRVHLELPAFEMSASYLYGYAPMPGLEYAGTFTAGSPDAHVDIRRRPYNHQVIGGDFSTTVADWLGVRGEVAYRLPMHWQTRDYAPNPDVMYVLGFDHTFDTVSVIAQYVGKYTIKWRAPPPPGSYGVDDLRRIGTEVDATTIPLVADAVPRAIYPHNQQLFGQEEHIQHMASLRVEWLALHQTLSMSALGLVNFSTGEWVAFPRVAYQFTDALTGTVGAELYEGPHDTLFGSISGELSAGYAEVKFSY